MARSKVWRVQGWLEVRVRFRRWKRRRDLVKGVSTDADINWACHQGKRRDLPKTLRYIEVAFSTPLKNSSSRFAEKWLESPQNRDNVSLTRLFGILRGLKRFRDENLIYHPLFSSPSTMNLFHSIVIRRISWNFGLCRARQVETDDHWSDSLRCVKFRMTLLFLKLDRCLTVDNLDTTKLIKALEVKPAITKWQWINENFLYIYGIRSRVGRDIWTFEYSIDVLVFSFFRSRD